MPRYDKRFPAVYENVDPEVGNEEELSFPAPGPSSEPSPDSTEDLKKRLAELKMQSEIYKDREKRRGEEMAEELKKYKESPAAFAEIERRRSDTRKPSIEGYKELEYKQPPEPSEFPEVVEQKLKRWESVEDRFKRPDSMETPEEKKERYKKLRELFTKKPSP